MNNNIKFKIYIYRLKKEETVAGGGFEPPSQGPEPRRIDHYPTRLLESKD